MTQFDENTITEAVLARTKQCDDSRQSQLLSALIKHTHAFVREVEPTEAEWFSAIEFLLATAAMTDDKRNEFILLSDTMGISMLVDAINNRKPEGGTESSVLGPFYQDGAPEVENDADLCGEGFDAEQVVLSGKVTDPQGNGIANALLDVWQTAPNGLYHMQDSDQPEHNLCGKLRTDAEGNYRFTTLKPVSYPVPTDGPVGKFLDACNQHAYRPAHIHFIVSAEGYQTVTTQLFTEGDEYIDSDAVFGVKDSLIVEYQLNPEDEQNWVVNFDFVLEAA